MDTAYVNHIIDTVLVRAEQLANIEGAEETAKLLRTFYRLLNYQRDGREWGLVRDEMLAVEDYCLLLRSCFGTRCSVQCTLSPDSFAMRKVLLDAVMDICPIDCIVHGRFATEVGISIRAHEQDGALADVNGFVAGEDFSESLPRSIRLLGG